MNPEHLIAQNVSEFIAIRHSVRDLVNGQRGTDGLPPRAGGGEESSFPFTISPDDDEEQILSKNDQKQLSAAATQAAEIKSLPYCFTVKGGLVAIIDIVGFTRLTNFLEEYSGSGGALVRDLLNRPFAKIIERIHAHHGSIVKFAGDAVIVAWSPGFNAQPDEYSDVMFCTQAVLCCIELLFLFRNYKISLPQGEEFSKISASLEQQEKEDPTSANPYQSTNLDSAGRMEFGFPQHRKNASSRQQPPNSPSSNRNGAVSANPGSRKSRQIPLRIHIGLAFGEISHVHLGELTPTTSVTSLSDSKPGGSKIHLSPIGSNDGGDQNQTILRSRTEYIIVGEAAEVAGRLLGLGQEGELVLCEKTMRHVEHTVNTHAGPKKEYSKGERVAVSDGPFDAFSMVERRENAFVISANSIIAEDKAKKLSAIIKVSMRSDRVQGEGEGCMNPEWNSGLLRLASAYLDEALAKFVHQHQTDSGWGGMGMGSTLAMNAIPAVGTPNSQRVSSAKPLKHSENAKGREGMTSNLLQPLSSQPSTAVSMIGLLPYGMNLDDASEYNQVRRVTIVFLRLTSFCVRDAASPCLLQTAQNVMLAALSSIRAFGGCLRQFNCDDKAASLLMVWGLEGFAHERGEPLYALSAALALSKKLEAIVGNEFSIGVCTGKVFSGMIGNSERADGTVLGVCVNLAARFMCDPLCQGRIICDKTTYLESKDEFEFADKSLQLKLKGSDKMTAAYLPIRKRAGYVKEENGATENETIYGRDSELAIIRKFVQDFVSGKQSAQLLISGATGTGKTLIVDYLKKAALENEIIFCHSRGSENFKYLMYFGFFQILVDLFRTIHPRLSEITAQRVRMENRKGSETRQRLSVVDLSASNSMVSINMNRSMSGLAINTQTYEEPAAIDVEEILKALGESRSSVSIFDSLFPMLRGVKEAGSQPFGDIGSRFPRLVIRILNAIASLNYKEYPKELEEPYNFILQLETLERIVLKQFDRHGTEVLLRGILGSSLQALKRLSPDLVRNIYERSQGVPFAVKVLALSVLHNSDMSTEEIPKDALTAIVAQFDRLPIEVKAVLRVAAIAGQTFSLVDVFAILTQGSFGVANSFNGPEDIRKTLTKSDPYHFVSRLGLLSGLSMSFSHYLIQQGILSTIIPKRKETIHRLFADYYEDTLNPGNAKTQLPLLVRQLLELPNEKYRKLKYTQIAFQEAAEKCMPTEGFMYYKIFQDLASQYGQYLDLTPLQKARHQKLLGLLHFESGNFLQASTCIIAAMKEVGLNLPSPSQPLRFLPMAIEAILLQKRLFKLHHEDQTLLSRKWAVKIAPFAFKGLSIHDMRSATKHRFLEKGNPILPTTELKDEELSIVGVSEEENDGEVSEDGGFATQDIRRQEPKVVRIVDTFTFNDAAKDVLQIFDIAVRILYNDRPGMQLLLVALMDLNLSTSVVPVPKEVVAKGLGRVACSCLAIGLINIGGRYRERATALTKEIDLESAHLDVNGLLNLAVSRLLQTSVDILESLGYGDAEFALIQKIAIFFTAAWCGGEVNAAIHGFESEHKKKLTLEQNNLCLNELELSLASLYGLKGQFKEMMYLYNIAGTRPNSKDSLIGGLWRQTKIILSALQVEVMMIIDSSILCMDGDATSWHMRAISSTMSLCDTVSKLTSVMILPIYSAWIQLIPLLIDWLIHRLQRQLPQNRHLKVQKLDNEETKVISVLLNVCKNRWSKAMRSRIPAYPSLVVLIQGVKCLLNFKALKFASYITKGIKMVEGTSFMSEMFRYRLQVRVIRVNAVATALANAKVPGWKGVEQKRSGAVAPFILPEAMAYFEKNRLMWEIEHVEKCLKMCGSYHK
ncbi:hypothetical protein HDU67_007571 [Dinochytrium kinnereticum]|nr:hypothetical protein HDU67_007571 [Dinochytrium kinnereticum]